MSQSVRVGRRIERSTMASIRLICPNCGATYEIEASAIPDTGRDVQCSNCAHIWFEEPTRPLAEDTATADPSAPPAEHDTPPSGAKAAAEVEANPTAAFGPESAASPDDSPEPGPTVSRRPTISVKRRAVTPVEPSGDDDTATGADRAADVPSPEPAPVAASAGIDTTAEATEDGPTPPAVQSSRRTLDSSIAEILREEAAREEAARRAEAGAADPFEEQGDLALDPPPAAPVEPRRAEARADRPRSTPEVATGKSRGDVFPDIEEINSSLDTHRVTDPDLYDDHAKTRSRRGGFLTVLGLIVLAMLVYAMADEIGQSLPALADPLDGYVDVVDVARLWLDAQARALADLLNAG
ncbi:zinc-ribbon domain-containing protein [Salipiger sp. IMCC34102]|uniref:zinc-ribbon domain-containing protein n=1 Tax=Salipiger sp. IMCC34102 TaxID=2510647 RepID=UPI0013EBF4ED|nr:zinc-ribbon domain-containing protein [Salipiger sp. IMCC34102]